MSRKDASRYLDARRLCAMKIGGCAAQLHRHEAGEVARDQAEGVRLAYVAATRARDLLVVPALGDEAWDGGWFGPLNRALYPPLASRRNAGRGPACPAFKSKDSVLQRPSDEPAGPGRSVRLHTCRRLGAAPTGRARLLRRVVGLERLKLDEKLTFGVRRDPSPTPKNVIADGTAATTAGISRDGRGCVFLR
jgi:hypothetical protein